MTLDEVSIVAVLIWHHDSNNSTTVVSHCNLIALIVSQHEEISLLSIYCGLKIFSFQTTLVNWFCIHNISFFSYSTLCSKVIYCKVTKKK